MSLVFLSLLLITLAVVVQLLWVIHQRYSHINKRVEKRLQDIADINRATAIGRGTEVVISNRSRVLEWLGKHRWVATINRKIAMSGRNIKIDEFLVSVFLSGVFFLAFCVALHLPIIVCLLATIAGSALPLLALNILVRRRQDMLEQQLPDVLDFIARSMQAGHSFSSSMQMAATESPEPIGAEFLVASNRINFGESIHNALASLSQRIECADMSYFAVAVLINREIGGDLAALLKNVAQLIRARLQLKMSIKALTGEARMSAWILGVIPFVLGLLLAVLQPKMMSLLFTDPMGRQMLGYGLLFMGIGVLWMRRLIHIRI